MGSSSLQALGFIISAIFGLLALVFGLRFIMQLVRADYFNPVSQMIVRLSDPISRPLRQLLPHLPRYDLASLFLAITAIFLELLLFRSLPLGNLSVAGRFLSPSDFAVGALVWLTLVETLNMFFNIFIFAMFIQALLSWVPQLQGNPVEGLLRRITEPLIAPLRQHIPPVGGLDLSFLVAIIGLMALKILVIGSLISLTPR